MTFAGIVACQVGTAFASCADRRRRLAEQPAAAMGDRLELAFAAALVYAPPLQEVFGTHALGPAELAILAPFPLVGADELRRARLRRRALSPRQRGAAPAGGPAG